MTPKELIEDFEYYKNGYNKLCGYEVKATNIRERKNDYVADITLIEDFGEVKTKYKGCVYPKNCLKRRLNGK